MHEHPLFHYSTLHIYIYLYQCIRPTLVEEMVNSKIIPVDGQHLKSKRNSDEMIQYKSVGGFRIGNFSILMRMSDGPKTTTI